ncbi:MAG: HD domain-containing protein [Patescibacteria group bacterium]|nr:HD domain-containing protein [Patescibacteria group bacterium]
MIPTEEQAKVLWDKYNLPEKKRIHSQKVADQAVLMARQIIKKNPSMFINIPLLSAGCLLHDIDKNIPKLAGEHHPDAGVRVLQHEGMGEVAELIRFHSVQYIEDPETVPKTLEEKLLFLADKMVKQEVIGVDKRFALWLSEEDLPEEQKKMLQRVYPKVKALEQEIYTYM